MKVLQLFFVPRRLEKPQQLILLLIRVSGNKRRPYLTVKRMCTVNHADNNNDNTNIGILIKISDKQSNEK
jgi:hypothetical protein